MWTCTHMTEKKRLRNNTGKTTGINADNAVRVMWEFWNLIHFVFTKGWQVDSGSVLRGCMRAGGKVTPNRLGADGCTGSKFKTAVYKSRI